MNELLRNAFLLCIAFMPAAVIPAPIEGAALDSALQGVWCSSTDGGKSCWGYDLMKSGKSQACGTLPETRQTYSASSTYTVSGSMVCHVVTHSSSGLLVPGTNICVNVLSIDGKTQRFLDPKSGAVTVAYRLSAKKLQCPGTV
jgi:hypothetical protein